MKLFFDTYAIIEIISGNPRYQVFFDQSFAFTKLNLIELHYYFLKEKPDSADLICEKYSDNSVAFSNEVIKKANQFRLDNRKKEYSTADCIGYSYALENGLTFVTGDKQFEGMPNVEFIK